MLFETFDTDSVKFDSTTETFDTGASGGELMIKHLHIQYSLKQ